MIFSKTAKLVITTSTTPFPVKGKLFYANNLWSPLAVCSITTTTFDPHATKSIAPPIPLTIFPGMIQLEISPVSEIYIAPNIVKSKCPPLIIANDKAES